MVGEKKKGRKRLSPHFAKKNARRQELIMKDFDSGLTPEEKAEEDELTEWCRKEVNRVYPIDYSWLEELERQAERLKKNGKRLSKLLNKLGIT